MRSQSNFRSFRHQIQRETCTFLDRIFKLGEEHHFTIRNRTQIMDSILASFDSAAVQYQNQQGPSVRNFLQTTLNNQSQKRIKQKICAKQITEVSGSTKLFAHIQSLNNSSAAQPQFFHRKQYLRLQNKDERSNLCFQNPSKIWKVLQQGLSENSNEKKISDQGYQSKSQNSQKKSYKLYPTQKKIQIISYSKIYGVKTASQKFKIPACKINVWSKSFQRIKGTRGRRPTDPQMQQKVVEWLTNQLEKGMVLTQKIIREKAKQISGTDQFKASKGWLQKFFKRRPKLFSAYTKNRLSARQVEQNEEMVKIQENSQLKESSFEQKQNHPVLDQEKIKLEYKVEQ